MKPKPTDIFLRGKEAEKRLFEIWHDMFCEFFPMRKPRNPGFVAWLNSTEFVDNTTAPARLVAKLKTLPPIELEDVTCNSFLRDVVRRNDLMPGVSYVHVILAARAVWDLYRADIRH